MYRTHHMHIHMYTYTHTVVTVSRGGRARLALGQARARPPPWRRTLLVWYLPPMYPHTQPPLTNTLGRRPRPDAQLTQY